MVDSFLHSSSMRDHWNERVYTTGYVTLDLHAHQVAVKPRHVAIVVLAWSARRVLWCEAE